MRVCSLVIKNGIMIEADDDNCFLQLSAHLKSAAESDDECQIHILHRVCRWQKVAEIETEIGELRSYLESIGDCVVVVNPMMRLSASAFIRTAG